MLKRREEQADRALIRAMEHLASMAVTIAPRDDKIAQGMVSLIVEINDLRRRIIEFHDSTWGGLQKRLWSVDDLAYVLDDAEPVRDYWGKTS